MNDLNQRKLSLMLCAALVLIGLSLGKIDQAQSLQATMTQASGSPLVFKTETPARACSQSCLSVKANLTNVSSEPIAIDTVGIRYEVQIWKSASSPSGGSVQVMTKRGDYGPGQDNESTYRVLKPGETYITTVKFPLTDKFFRGKGTYKIKITYGQFRQYAFQGAELFKGTVESNELEFGIADCSHKETRKTPDCK